MDVTIYDQTDPDGRPATPDGRPATPDEITNALAGMTAADGTSYLDLLLSDDD